MSETKDKPFDPFAAWRDVRDASMDAWAKAMVDAVNSEAYTQATGAMLGTYLTASAPFREALEKAMTHAIEQLSLPTRTDVIGLAERLTNIEMRLDDLDAKLDAIATPDSVRQPEAARKAEPKKEEPKKKERS